MDSDLFIKKITLERDKIDNYDVYPFNIDVVRQLNEIKFNKPVTFLVGENGVGKSTFIEALAVSVGLNAEGGSQNFNFSTQNTHSNLSDYIRVSRFNKPKLKFFLRAESFYNVASEIIRISEEGSQFIMATHSPILISYIDGEIMDLNNNFEIVKYEDTEIYKTYKMYLDDPYRMQEMLFRE